jgi:plasmid stabilization system protein ParE
MVQRKIIWSVEARLDLFDILDFYIKRNGSAVYSKKLNLRFQKSVQLISKNPFIGSQTDFDLVLTLINDEYQIVYEIFDQFILIILIWDCRRNPEDKRIGTRLK